MAYLNWSKDLDTGIEVIDNSIDASSITINELELPSARQMLPL